MRTVLLALILLVGSCTNERPIEDIPLTDLNGAQTSIDLAAHHVTVIAFLSPECPLCINYSRNLKATYDRFAAQDVALVGVFAGKWFSPQEVGAFATKYDLAFPMVLDEDNSLAKKLGATITPEVFVVNSQGQVLYSGGIDNRMNALGKMKQQVTAHYLDDAIEADLDGRGISPEKTKAIGCLIE